MCKIYHFVISLSHTASVFILVVTALERYCVILYPLRSLWLLTMRRKHVSSSFFAISGTGGPLVECYKAVETQLASRMVRCDSSAMFLFSAHYSARVATQCRPFPSQILLRHTH